MLSKRRGDAVVVWAPAKVNLFLEVLAKRSDGYHEIATLMVAVTLFDTLKFKEETTGEVRLTSNHPTLSTGSDNLIHRAAVLLQAKARGRPGARIHLTKRIPTAAGLAGGSSDAAATLTGLNCLWRLGLLHSELADLAAELGSDVAFFFSGPAAWCTGRGEQVSPLTLGQPLWLVLVFPGFGLATAAVYSQVFVPPRPRAGKAIQEAAQEGRVEVISRELFNRLEEPANELCPAIHRYRDRLLETKPAGVLLSGSGPTLFALCRDRREAMRVAHQLRHGPEEETPPRVFLVRSCS
jgi:4-diphosphocytidyl-2-C-methyl-D-erythritol kinase